MTTITTYLTSAGADQVTTVNAIATIAGWWIT